MTAPTATSGRNRVMTVLVAVLTVVFAVVCGVQGFRIGDSGARAAWGDVRYTPQTHAFQRP
jgi:zinc transporter ZupT